MVRAFLAVLGSSKGFDLVIGVDVFLRRVLELHLLAPDAWFSDGVAYPRPAWFSTDLLPKLARWASENKSSEFSSTLSLLPVEKYSVTYQQLKAKYKAMVKVTHARALVFPAAALIVALRVSALVVLSVGLARGHGSREVRV